MTVSPKMDFLMQAVLKNIEVKGSTMGSRKEFKDMIDFVKRTNASVPVSRVVKWDASGDDIKDVDGLFEDMKKASQFGKLVIEITGSSGGESKL
jgi:D-arabinose 1-dehydrogenase-like Zn-dependent alcohol dehydrogenase